MLDGPLPKQPSFELRQQMAEFINTTLPEGDAWASLPLSETERLAITREGDEQAIVRVTELSNTAGGVTTSEVHTIQDVVSLRLQQFSTSYDEQPKALADSKALEARESDDKEAIQELRAQGIPEIVTKKVLPEMRVEDLLNDPAAIQKIGNFLQDAQAVAELEADVDVNTITDAELAQTLKEAMEARERVAMALTAVLSRALWAGQ